MRVPHDHWLVAGMIAAGYRVRPGSAGASESAARDLGTGQRLRAEAAEGFARFLSRT
jgi:hypothetical protein